MALPSNLAHLGTSLADMLKLRASLFEARMGGTRRVRDASGEEVEFKSDSEMAKALAALDSEIAAQSKAPRSTHHFQTSKGL